MKFSTLAVAAVAAVANFTSSTVAQSKTEASLFWPAPSSQNAPAKVVGSVLAVNEDKTTVAVICQDTRADGCFWTATDTLTYGPSYVGWASNFFTSTAVGASATLTGTRHLNCDVTTSSQDATCTWFNEVSATSDAESFQSTEYSGAEIFNTLTVTITAGAAKLAQTTIAASTTSGTKVIVVSNTANDTLASGATASTTTTTDSATNSSTSSAAASLPLGTGAAPMITAAPLLAALAFAAAAF